MVRLWFHTNWKGVLVSLLLSTVIFRLFRLTNITISESFCMEPVPDRASIHKSQRWFQREFCNRTKLRQVDLSFRVDTKSWSGGNIALDFLVFYVCRSAPCCPGNGGEGGNPLYKPYRYVPPQRVWYRTLIPDQNGPAKSIPVFRAKRRKKKTLWGGKCLCGLYKGVPPRVFSNPKDEITCKIKQLFWTLGPFIRGKIRRELSV